MSTVIEQLNDWSQRGSDLLVPILWQSTLIAIAVWLLTALLRKSSPRLRYWLWQLVAIKLLLMPFWSVDVSLPEWSRLAPAARSDVSTPLPHDDVRLRGAAMPGEAASRTGPQITAGSSAASAPSATSVLPQVTWKSWLLLFWLAVVGAQVLRLIRQRLRLRRLIRSARLASGPLVTSVCEAAEMLQLNRVPRVVLTGDACSPFVCGVHRPTLVLPRELAASLEAARLRHVLLHELAHLKFRDLLWNWVPEIARMLYFFHPVAHWARHHIRLEQELACDQRALTVGGGQPTDYVDTLLQVVSRASEPAILKMGTATAGLIDGAPSLNETPRPKAVGRGRESFQ